MKLFIVSLLSLISFVSFAQDVKNISAEELLAQADDILLIDVRSAEEYNEGHVPGAINIAHSEIQDRLSELLDYKDKPVVVYCRSGVRAGKAAKILLDNQFSQLKHLEGDMKGWKKSGRTIEK